MSVEVAFLALRSRLEASLIGGLAGLAGAAQLHRLSALCTADIPCFIISPGSTVLSVFVTFVWVIVLVRPHNVEHQLLDGRPRKPTLGRTEFC